MSPGMPRLSWDVRGAEKTGALALTAVNRLAGAARTVRPSGHLTLQHSSIRQTISRRPQILPPQPWQR